MYVLWVSGGCCVRSNDSVKSQLPPYFCLDIFFKYRKYDQACQYLFYRREFDDLLQMIKFEYDAHKDICDDLAR